MKIDNILTRYNASQSNISRFRVMLLDEYFPKFSDFPSEKIVEKAGEVLHEMVYLHSILSLKANPNFEIWEMARWLSGNRYLNYTFVSSNCGCGEAYSYLASFLGTSIYEWCSNHSIDDKTKQTLMNLFEQADWERG